MREITVEEMLIAIGDACTNNDDCVHVCNRNPSVYCIVAIQKALNLEAFNEDLRLICD